MPDLILGGKMRISAKETLHKAIDLLNEEEASQILQVTRRLRKESGGSQTLKRLSQDVTFHVPASVSVGFRPVKPVRGKGVAASQLLVQDRLSFAVAESLCGSGGSADLRGLRSRTDGGRTVGWPRDR